MKGTLRISGVILIILLIHSCKKDNDNSIKDIDGNVYTSVTISTQVWLIENLKTTKYNDGTAIPLVTDNTAWSNLSTPGYCWYNNDANTYEGTYGALYNWYTVNTGKLCPTGWHVPTDAEFATLINYLGGPLSAGNKLKETGITHWASPNTGATNESGFTALPGGARTENDGIFFHIRDEGNWWSASESDATFAWNRYLTYSNPDSYSVYNYKQIGFSVRCLQDN